jgi:hypothetical protein
MKRATNRTDNLALSQIEAQTRIGASLKLKYFPSMEKMLQRLNEHEMNVFDGEERPPSLDRSGLISFEEVSRLLTKGGRDGSGLTPKEIKALDVYGGWCSHTW